MGKKKILEHQQNKFEQHIGTLEKKTIKKEQRVQQPPKLQQKRPIQEQVQKKKNLFALDSDDEVQEQTELKNWKLTHNGQDLNEDYNDQVPVSSDDELPKGFVKNNHFVGFDQNQDKRKSKKEIYEEIIQNSKQRKAEKQKQKEDNHTKILQLNEALPQILDVLPIKKKPQAPQKEELDYFELMETFKADNKVQIETVVHQSEKDQTNYMRQKREENKKRKIEEAKTQLQQDSDDEEDDEVENDDCVSKRYKNAKEKKMLKSYKKVEHMQKVMEHLRNVQNKTKNGQVKKNEQINQDDDDEDLDEVVSDDEYEDDSEDDEFSENGEEGEDDDEGEEGEEGEEGDEDDDEENEDDEEEEIQQDDENNPNKDSSN